MLSQESNKVVIKAEVEVEDFQKKVDMTLRNLSKKASIPGFRKGKVPKKVLEMRFGKEAIYAETLDDMLPEIIGDIVRDYELDLINEPALKVEKMAEKEPLELEFTFEVKPEVILPDLNSIEVEKKEVNITDEMIDSTIEQAREQLAEYPQVADRTVVGNGDFVDVSYTTRIVDINGEVIKSHEPGETTIALETKDLKQEIIDSLVGQNVGSHVEVEIPIEDEHPDKEIAGKKAIYSMEIKGIKTKILPDLNEDFFKKTTGEDGLTLSDFKTRVRDGLHARLESEYKAELEDSAVDKLAILADVDLPDILLERQEASIRQQDEENCKKRFNKSIKDFFADSSLDKEKYEADIKEQAKKAVARYLAMDALSTKENVDVTKDDIQKEIAAIASSYKIEPERIMGSIAKDQDRLLELSSRIKYRKTVEILLNSVTVKNNTPAAEESAVAE